MHSYSLEQDIKYYKLNVTDFNWAFFELNNLLNLYLYKFNYDMEDIKKFVLVYKNEWIREIGEKNNLIERLQKTQIKIPSLLDLWSGFEEPINFSINDFFNQKNQEIIISYNNYFDDEMKIREKLAWFFIKFRNLIKLF